MDWPLDRFRRDLHTFDPLLRVRLASGPNATAWLIERRVRHNERCLILPRTFQHRDAYVAARDGYLHVLTVPRGMLDRRVFVALYTGDMWRAGGADRYLDQLEAAEEATEAQRQSADSTRLTDISADVYDKLRLMGRGKHAGSDFYVNERLFNVGIPTALSTPTVSTEVPA